MTEAEALDLAKTATGGCFHGSQWSDPSLIACEPCIAAAILRAVEAERERAATYVERGGCSKEWGITYMTPSKGDK